ncbi:unnamed protein product [Acanthoscelides obtectus]|uniref:FLYWCH-type domain-containing protein n=1 Tax=Acanthoscelides obtectus TaxID=200917 RepID=A0A9P0L5D3_ACAOB|nr:unnamed protein product [Acanthoscelides obtectus]CAK1676617.1 hypothetical protein AOBTE_LOCUS30859 [Acanthoscelides obtectus]
MGHKNPKIILRNNDYLIYRKLPDKTVWSCTQYHKKDRCKAKVVTSARQATLVGMHNHTPTCRRRSGNYSLSQTVTIKRAATYNNYDNL